MQSNGPRESKVLGFVYILAACVVGAIALLAIWNEQLRVLLGLMIGVGVWWIIAQTRSVSDQWAKRLNDPITWLTDLTRREIRTGKRSKQRK
jgi:cadmium resistance protein CadD (predicted permease)